MTRTKRRQIDLKTSAAAKSPVLSGTNAGIRKRTLFATIATDRPWPGALLRAEILADLLGAELYVLGVVPILPRLNMLFPHRNAQDAVDLPQNEVLAAERTRYWCNRVLPRKLSEERLLVTTANFVDAVVETAARTNSTLVVIPPFERNRGTLATDIARRSGCPVLVARPVSSGQTIVAATNLADRHYPVARAGVALGRRLGAQVVLMHNLEPASGSLPVTDRDPALPLAYVGVESRQERAERLRTVARLLCDDGGAAVVSRTSTADAILEVMDRDRADLVVVGLPRRTGIGQWLHGPRVAERVVNQASRSVLVLPLSA